MSNFVPLIPTSSENRKRASGSHAPRSTKLDFISINYVYATYTDVCRCSLKETITGGSTEHRYKGLEGRR